MAWRPESTAELTGARDSSILGEVFNMYRQYSTIMSNLEDAEYTRQMRSEQKTGYQLGALTNTGDALKEAMKSNDKKLITTYANQMVDYASKIPDDGRDASRQIVGVEVNRAKNALHDVQVMDEFDQFYEQGTARGGMFDYDKFAATKNKKQFIAAYDEGMQSIDDMRKKLKYNGISNLESYNELLDHEESMLNKIKQVAGYNLDLPQREDSWERMWITNARAGTGIQDPEQQWQKYKDDFDGLNVSIKGHQDAMVEYENDYITFANDRLNTEEEIAAKREEINGYKELENERLRQATERRDKLSGILTNSRSLDWTGVGDPSSSDRDERGLTKKEAGTLKIDIDEIQSWMNTPGFSTAYDIGQKDPKTGKMKYVDDDGFLIDSEGKPFNYSQINDIKYDMQKEWDQHQGVIRKKKEEEEEKQAIKIYGEENNKIRQKYKLPLKHPTMDEKVYKSYMTRIGQIEKVTEKKKELAETVKAKYKEMQDLEKTIAQQKVLIKREPDASVRKELNSSMKKAQNQVDAIKKKYGKKKQVQQVGPTVGPITPSYTYKFDEKQIEKIDADYVNQQQKLDDYIKVIQEGL